MALMDFFRRPLIAGKGLTRVPFPTVRGNVRRSDADGASAVPYFPTITPGDTLIVNIDGTPHTITITAKSLAQVLIDINTALGATLASDADGTVQIQSSTAGTGSIQVTGGAAAPKLGFDVTAGPVISKGGDLPSAPEARVGNPFGSIFPVKDENFTTESVLRALGMVAGNTDVLFSDIAREQPFMQKVNSSEYTVSADGGRIILNPSSAVRVFTGSPLSASSTKEQLSPYFSIIDQATGQPTLYRVAAVTNGDPGVDVNTNPNNPPYANTASWTAADGGNVLGRDLTKLTGTISAISADGRTVTISGADLVALGSQSGDLVEITGATNTSKWSNNGYRWAIESVIDSTHCTVRPMSQSELVVAGQDLSVANHPIVELASDISGGQVFGSLVVHTGSYMNKMTLVVRPPLPVGSTFAFDLYATQPLSHRGAKPWQFSEAESFLARPQASDLDTEPNGIYGQPAVTFNGVANYTVGAFWARWHGRIVRVPQTTLDVSNGIIYWDERDGRVTSPTQFGGEGPTLDQTQFVPPQIPDPSASGSEVYWPNGGKGHLIATVSGATITPMAKSLGSSMTTVTVGHSGNFQTLDEAVNYLNELWSLVGFPIFGFSGDFPHFDIVLLSDTQFVSTLNIQVPSLTIRGANGNVLLNGNPAVYTSGLFLCSGNTKLELRDLSLGLTSSFTGQVLVSGGDTVKLKNIFQFFGSGWQCLWEVAQNVSNVIIEDCSFTLSAAVVGAGCSTLSMLRTSVAQFGSDFQFITGASGSPSNATHSEMSSVVVRDSTISNLLAGTVFSVIVDDNGTGKFLFENTVFACQSGNAAVAGSLLFTMGGTFSFRNCTFTGVRALNSVSGSSWEILFDSCSMAIRPAASETAIVASTIRNCTITATDPAAAATNTIGVSVAKMALGNIVTGPLAYGIKSAATSFPTSGLPSQILHNYVAVVTSANLGTVMAGIAGVDYTTISKNFVSVTSGSGIGDGTNSWKYSEISGNRVMLVGTSNVAGISLKGDMTGDQFSDNFIFVQPGVSIVTGVVGFSLDSNGVGFSSSDMAFKGNVIDVVCSPASTRSTGVITAGSGWTAPDIRNCKITADTAFSFVQVPSIYDCVIQTDNITISGRFFDSVVNANGTVTLQDGPTIVGCDISTAGAINQQMTAGQNFTQTIRSSILSGAVTVFAGITNLASLPGSTAKVYWENSRIVGSLTWATYTNAGNFVFMSSIYSMDGCHITGSISQPNQYTAGSMVLRNSEVASGTTSFFNGSANYGGLNIEATIFSGTSVTVNHASKFNNNTVNCQFTCSAITGSYCAFSGNRVYTTGTVSLTQMMGAGNLIGSTSFQPSSITMNGCELSSSKFDMAGATLVNGKFMGCEFPNGGATTTQNSASGNVLFLEGCRIGGDLTIEQSVVKLTIIGCQVDGFLSTMFSGTFFFSPPEIFISGSYFLNHINLVMAQNVFISNTHFVGNDNGPHAIEIKNGGAPGQAQISSSYFGGSGAVELDGEIYLDGTQFDGTLSDLIFGVAQTIDSLQAANCTFGAINLNHAHAAQMVNCNVAGTTLMASGGGGSAYRFSNCIFTGGITSLTNDIISIQGGLIGGAATTTADLFSTFSLIIDGVRATARLRVEASTAGGLIEIYGSDLRSGVWWTSDNGTTVVVRGNSIYRSWSSSVSQDACIIFTTCVQGRIIITDNHIFADNSTMTAANSSGSFPVILALAAASGGVNDHVRRLQFSNNTVRMTDSAPTLETVGVAADALVLGGNVYECMFTSNIMEVAADSTHNGHTHAFRFLAFIGTTYTTIVNGTLAVKTDFTDTNTGTALGGVSTVYQGALEYIDNTINYGL